MAKRQRPPVIVPEPVLAPARVADRDLTKFEDAWWKKQTLTECGLSLSAVVLEFQFQVCRYIVGRLNDAATPDPVKDAFALRGMPNLGVIFKNPDATGSLSFGTAPGHPTEAPVAAEGAVPNVSSVLEAYRTQGKLPH